MRTVLLIAAEKRELAGLARFGVRTVGLQLPLGYLARLSRGDEEWVLAADGPGTGLAGALARRLLRQVPAAAVVSTGYCGALDPRLKAGDIVVASEVLDAASGRRFSSLRPAGGHEAAHGRVVTGNRVIGKAGEKARWWSSTGAVAVEMEAAAVAEAAEECKVPFFCVRVVSDTAREEFALDLNAARDEAGRFATGRLLRQCLRQPGLGARELWRWWRRSREAARRLGDYLVDCRF